MLCILWPCLACMPIVAAQPQHATATAARSASQLEQGDPTQRRSYLGISLRDLDSDRIATLNLPDDRGVEVSRVRPGSPAEKAGIKAGDILLIYNGENISSVQQLARLVAETPSGRRVHVQLWREGKVQSTRLVTAAPPLAITQVGADGPSSPSFPAAATIGIPNMPTPALTWRNFVLGIVCEPVDSQLAEFFGVKQGLLIRYVETASLANHLGLQAGDVVTTIDDRTIETPQDLSLALGGVVHAAQGVTLTIMRDHRKKSFALPVKQR